MICWKCGKDIDYTDNYCKYCGAGQGAYVPIYYHHIGIIILFFLIGPFNLIFVWRSPLLSKISKWIYTIIFTLLTFWFIHRTMIAMQQILSIYSGLTSTPF